MAPSAPTLPGRAVRAGARHSCAQPVRSSSAGQLLRRTASAPHLRTPMPVHQEPRPDRVPRSATVAACVSLSSGTPPCEDGMSVRASLNLTLPLCCLNLATCAGLSSPAVSRARNSSFWRCLLGAATWKSSWLCSCAARPASSPVDWDVRPLASRLRTLPSEKPARFMTFIQGCIGLSVIQLSPQLFVIIVTALCGGDPNRAMQPFVIGSQSFVSVLVEAAGPKSWGGMNYSNHPPSWTSRIVYRNRFGKPDGALAGLNAQI